MERLDAYIDGELTQPEREAFLSHAQNCSTCREALWETEAIHDALAHMNDGLRPPLEAQAGWRAAVKREARRRKTRVLYRAVSAVAAAFVLLAGTTAVFRATGVLDFDADTAPASGVHIATSAPRAEYYDADPETYSVSDDPTLARHALVEADGAAENSNAVIAGDGQSPAPASAGAGASASALTSEARTEDTAIEENADESSSEVETAKKRLFARSAVRELHSDNFDATHQSILDLVEEYNGHVVSDTRSGQEGARNATIAADVPSDELDAFLEALDFVADVAYQSVNSEDISDNYYDVQGRLETLRLERDRLNELISSAADADELEALDAQLEEVYTQIDTLESKLRNFDSQLEYARVDIVLREGAQLEATAITGGTTTGGTAEQGLNRSLESLGAFFRDMGVSLAVIAPYAGIAVGVVALIALVWAGITLINRRRKHD
ncbi:MAG TPA: DUF4349 domain-containing protein [Candidatus Pullichristensenella stercorigallinarum]|uniref:Anti-sigma-W factor RsiW n=1 Tax=Candidatus Pullichristensenella stercorigallinarum TaxID=2840909 RepID=A0A9D1CX12_9FIRM|nr:DUF4349 domain-containing protein [Candidatus Pullichristensenella stercorigallinarum]